jgi:coproporphyrinogen III oxidase
MTIALDQSQQRKETAEAWFQSLQLRIFKAFEALEDDAPGPFAPEAPAA